MQGKSLTLLLFVLYGSAFLAGFNENLMNVALVSIMSEYGIDSVAAQWTVTGYMIAGTIVVMCMAFSFAASRCARCISLLRCSASSGRCLAFSHRASRC